MECVYGTTKYKGQLYDTLKTIGKEHTDLTGEHTIERKYSDNIITDTFKVVKKYRSKEDSDGNCYDWYIISDHYRDSDKYTPASMEIKDNFNTIGEAMDTVLTEELPSQSEQIQTVSDAVDYILTDVIPGLLEG